MKTLTTRGFMPPSPLPHSVENCGAIFVRYNKSLFYFKKCLALLENLMYIINNDSEQQKTPDCSEVLL